MTLLALLMATTSYVHFECHITHVETWWYSTPSLQGEPEYREFPAWHTRYQELCAEPEYADLERFWRGIIHDFIH